MVQQWNFYGVTVELYGIIIQLLWGHKGARMGQNGNVMGTPWSSYVFIMLPL